jgi:hypothetical protein
MTTTITERAERGAALLDEKRPGWLRRIDLGRLNLADTCDCPAGQITGSPVYLTDWILVMESLGLDAPGLPAAYGFDGPEEECEALTAAWRDLIQVRLGLAGVPA